jgi:alginate O-acetyltransferase complex protein AlgI
MGIFQSEFTRGGLFDLRKMTHLDFTKLGINIATNRTELAISFIVILIMEAIHLLQRNSKMAHKIFEKPIYLRWVFYYVVVIIIMFLGKYESQEFIYFQF